MYQNLKENQNNPQEFLDKLMSNYSQEQRANFMKFANNFGFSNEQLNQFGINANK